MAYSTTVQLFTSKQQCPDSTQFLLDVFLVVCAYLRLSIPRAIFTYCMYRRGQSEEYLLSRSTYYPGVLTVQEYLLSRSTYCPGVLTNPSTY